MAMSFSFRTIENGAREIVLQVVGIDAATTTAGVSDGTSTALLATNVSGYTASVHNKIRRIIYNTTNCAARLQWHATSDTEAITLSGYGDYNLDFARSGTQGIFPDTGAGATGDLDLTSYATATIGGTPGLSAAMSLTLYLTKGV